MAFLNRGELEGVRILTADSVDAMLTPEFGKPSEFWSHVGLTWNLGTRQGHRIVGHGGEDVGFSTGPVHAPDDRLGLVYLRNSDGCKIDSTGDAILDLLLQ